MSRINFQRVRGFLVVYFAFLILGGLEVLFSAQGKEPENQKQDNVYSEESFFDAKLNLVSKTSRAKENYQRPEVGTHYFLEAHNLFRVSEAQKDKYWNVKPPSWPLWHKGIIGMAGPSENIGRMALQTADPIFPKVSGKHRLWIRWVRWKNLPAPLNVKISQGENLVAEQQIGRDTADNLDPYQAVIVWEPIDVTLEAGKPVFVVFEKTPDRRLAGDRIIDAIYLTSNLDYQPVGRTQLPQIEQLKEWRADLKMSGPLAFWPATNVWQPFGINDRPEPWDVRASGEIVACQNEVEQMLVRVTSLADKPGNFQIKAAPFINAAGESFSAPEIRIATQIKSRRYGWVPGALLRRDTLELQPFHTTGLWIKVDTHGLAPGVYHSTISLLEGEISGDFQLKLTVRAVSLEPRNDFLVTVWTEPKEMPAPPGLDIDKLMLEDLSNHRINFMNFHNWDAKYAEEYKKLNFMAGWKPTEPWAFFQDRGTPWDEVADEPKLKEMLDQVRAYQKKIGFEDKLFVTQFGDEFPLSEHWVQTISASKKLDPTLKVLMTTYLVDTHDVKKMKGLTDFWMATPDVYRGSSLVTAIEEAGATPLLYSPLFYDGADATTPWMRLRRMGWFCLEKGIKGMGFYCYNGYNGDAWQDGTLTRYDNSPVQEAAVYPGTNGPVPSPSWEAWRESAEDVSLLMQLQDKINDPALSAADKDRLVLLWQRSMHEINNIERAETFETVKQRIVDELEPKNNR